MTARWAPVASKTEQAKVEPVIRTARTLTQRRLNVDTSRLDGEAAGQANKLRRAVYQYARANGVDDGSVDALLSEALHGSLRVDGRRGQVSGSQYAVLALRVTLRPIFDALEHWDEAPAAQILEALNERWRRMAEEARFGLDLADVPHWLRAHAADSDGAEAVAQCIALDAPEEVRIEFRLAQAGMQKRVFAANWTVADDPTEIVLKEFLGEPEQVLIRERRPHPLSMTHPNIIETFMLDNQAPTPQTFLVERRLEVLDDTTRLSGLAERARLLLDISRALAFLADQGLVHGDVKPDNIGVRDGRFVLLDFGIARPAREFIGDMDQTGSLRTRAPEVLLDEQHHTVKSDVWALGATMFNVLVGRFPLFDRGEGPPRGEAERAAFEDTLKRRVRDEWDSRLSGLDDIPHRGVREIVLKMLDRDPATRPDAAEVLRRALRELVALVGVQEGPRFAASSELDALRRYLAPDAEQIALLPDRRRNDLDQRLKVLERALRAQRHYQGAADRVAMVAEIELQDPMHHKDSRVEARLERLARLARGFRTPEDQCDLDLLEAVRIQLRLGAPPEHTQHESLLEALHAALEDAKEATHEDALTDAAVELQRLLPRT